MLIKYLKSYGYLFGIILVLTIILSIINYFVVLPTGVIKIIIPIIGLFVGSMMLGRSIKEKAYLEGIKFASLYLVLVTIFKLIFRTGFSIKVIVLYILFMFTSIVGSMIGINIRKN